MPLQVQARALGDPTRYAIFRYLADADSPVDVAELTEHLDLNHNSIRHHLAHLVAAELVDEATAESSGRGRPRLLYSVSPTTESRWGAVGPYERLAVLLTTVVRTGDSPVDVGRRAGGDIAGPVDDDAEPLDVMVQAMARQGFDPLVVHTGDRCEVALQACPFEAAALADPDTVCSLHLGMAEGIAAATDGRVVVDRLVPRDPRAAGCRLHLEVATRSG
ncbi:MAG: helix-turn-helix domain-containing protein [Acidimicrobiia bacterium]